MNVDEVRRNLRRDLDLLRAPEGYLFAGLPRYRTLFGRALTNVIENALHADAHDRSNDCEGDVASLGPIPRSPVQLTLRRGTGKDPA